MTYKQLLEKIGKIPLEHLNEQVAVNIYSTNDTYQVRALDYATVNDHLSLGLEVGQFYLECLDLIN